MPGSDDTARAWRDALLLSNHSLPVIAATGREVRSLNRAARALFGEVPTGADVYALFDVPSRRKLETALGRGGAVEVTELQSERRGDLPVALEFLIFKEADGGYLLVACASSRAPDGAAFSKLMALNDELVDLTRGLSREKRDLEYERQALTRLGNLRELFIAAMAHDLKAPLQAIIFSEDLLKHRAESDATLDVHQHTARIERQARRMLHLIDNLLLMARLDSTTPGLPVQSLDLAAVAREAAVDLEPLAREAQIAVDVAASGDTRVHGNPVWLGEVFANLIANALRYSPRHARVQVDIWQIAEGVRAAVTDRGPGVPAAQREAVFERFVQHGERKGAAGLGLHVCKRVIQLHAGRIWVEDGPGSGARFVFELPIGVP